MPAMTLVSLLSPYFTLPSVWDRAVTGVTLDSRLVQPGDLFFALTGAQVDGKQFVQEAITKGAVAIVAEGEQDPEWQGYVPIIYLPHLKDKIGSIAATFYQDPLQALQVIGVTGTNGKTSCSHYVASALEYFQKPCGVIGTLGSGRFGHVNTAKLTTPDALTLQKTFATFVSAGLQAVAMEVSSHSIDQGRILGIPFAVGLFTNLTRDHLDYHGTMAAYGQVKKSWLTSPSVQQCVINIDDPFGLEMVVELAALKPVVAYSLEQHDCPVPCVYTTEIQSSLQGIRAVVHTPWGSGTLETSLLGRFNLSNVLAVLTGLCVLGFPLPEVLQAVRQFKAVSGRMETFGDADQPLVVVDYSHTPDSLEKALQALRPHCEGKLYCLFGCGGDRDKGKRPIMASIAERLADVVMVTDDNPRHEKSEQIAADIMQGFQQPSQIIVELDRSKAIQDIIQCAKVGDCILIAGRGGETHQLVGDRKIPFNDSEKVALMMAKRRE